MQHTIGVDISKDTLDVYRLTDKQHIQVSNDKSGHKALIRWIRKGRLPLTVFEATGAYHRQLEMALSKSQLPFTKVNPRRARRFAEATGRLAKTGRVDAAMLARMGAVLELSAQEAINENLYDLKELMTARRALIRDKTAATARLKTASQALLMPQLTARLKQVERQLLQIDAAIAKIVAQDETLSSKLAILISIPGIAQTTAFAILIDMPELGALEGKQAACLAGLAPISRQSGKWQGKERIQGGRAMLRRAIYMPTLVAMRHNHILKAKFQQLVDAGKPPKVAITACMRKLILLANALLRDRRKWSIIRP